MIPPDSKDLSVEDQVTTTRWLSAVADRVLNPVTGIRAALEIMERRLATEPLRERPVIETALDRIKRSLVSLSLFVEDLGSYANPCTLSIENMSVSSLLNRALLSVQQRTLIDVVVHSRLTPGMYVAVDEAKMIQVLSILILNAIESTPLQDKPEIGVSTRLEKEGFLTWIIDDNGHGLSPEFLRNPFRPFFSTKEAQAGIGLAIAKKFVEAHRGTIRLEPRPSGGTRALLTMPVSFQPQD